MKMIDLVQVFFCFISWMWSFLWFVLFRVSGFCFLCRFRSLSLVRVVLWFLVFFCGLLGLLVLCWFGNLVVIWYFEFF